MWKRTGSIAAYALAFVLGAPAAFFTVGPALFADGSAAEAYAMVPIAAAVFFGLGLGAGLLVPGYAWRAGAFLAAPAVPVALFFVAADGFRLDLALLGLSLVAGVAAGALGGAVLGSRWRTHWTPRRRGAGEAGEVSVEYAMVIALVVFLLVVTLSQLGNALNDIFVRIAGYF